MCGILIHKGLGKRRFVKNRGLIHTLKEKNGLFFEHWLLPITGEVTRQPFVDGNIVCLYNGEIYNHPFEKSDGEVIIPLYRKYGKDFVKHLDGEFAVALYDFEKDLVYFATDRFGTKPLWVKGIECGSYESCVGGVRVEPNTLLSFRISTESVVSVERYHVWDFNQFKTSYDDFIKAFDLAVEKRATDRCFIGLSSGYDSGAISWALTKTGVDFKAFSVLNNENDDIVRARAKYCYEWDELKIDEQKSWKLVERVEDAEMKSTAAKHLTQDIATYGLATICERANREGRKVCLSGQGADEIIGDYALYPKQSAFKGIFPEKLEEWENFTGGLQQDYLTKEEYVGGAFAIETRYPFLDTQVVQEFLWLSPELKNRCYKAPIDEYLTRNHVPYDKNVKKGFRPF